MDGSDGEELAELHATTEQMTLEDLSGEFGVSRERVRQIEVRAFEKVQKEVQKSARELDRRPAELASPD